MTPAASDERAMGVSNRRTGARRFAAAQKGSQIGGEGPHRRITVLDLLCQRPPQHAVDPGRDVRMRGRDEIRFSIENRLREALRVVPVERPYAGQHLVDQDSKRPDIASAVDWRAPEMLGAHIREGAEASVGRRRGQGFCRRNAEVEDLDGAVWQEHDVRRLDIAMHHAARVRATDSTRDLHGDMDCIVERQASAFQAGLHGLAVIERHDDEQLPVFSLANLENRADVGIVERRRGARLDEEALLRCRLFAQVWRQELQGHMTVEPSVVRLVNDPHPAGIEQFLDQILPDSSSLPSGDLRTGPGGRRRDCGRETIDGARASRVTRAAIPLHAEAPRRRRIA